jgi:Polyketide cyclase / dehydrase and lipid transport
MTRVRASAVIDRHAEKIWERIRDFSSHTGWIPGATSLVLLEGSGTSIGALRRIHFSNGIQHDARLTALDDHTYFIGYELVGELPWPIFNVSGYVQLHSVTLSDATLVERVVWFDSSHGAREAREIGASIKQTLARSLDMLASSCV